MSLLLEEDRLRQKEEAGKGERKEAELSVRFDVGRGGKKGGYQEQVVSSASGECSRLGSRGVGDWELTPPDA